MVPDVANAPTTVPTTSTATAITMRFFAPIRRARNPAGKASTMPTNVNTDMSIEVEAMSMPNVSMRAGMTEGTLYCPRATAMPATTRTIATATWFW